MASRGQKEHSLWPLSPPYSFPSAQMPLEPGKKMDGADMTAPPRIISSYKALSAMMVRGVEVGQTETRS